MSSARCSIAVPALLVRRVRRASAPRSRPPAHESCRWRPTFSSPGQQSRLTGSPSATRTPSSSHPACSSLQATRGLVDKESSPGMRNASNASSGSSSAEGYIRAVVCVARARRSAALPYEISPKSDLVLDRYCQALILRLKIEAGTKSGATEPPSVQRLRSASAPGSSTATTNASGDECPEGPLWAPVRAKCLAEYSTLRARELDDALRSARPHDAASRAVKTQS